MRNNRMLKTDWMRKIRFADEYKIEIIMFCGDGETTLNIFLDIDGENVDNECIMCIDEEIDVPTPEMKRKFNQVSKYFKQHFENVNAIEKIVVV